MMPKISYLLVILTVVQYVSAIDDECSKNIFNSTHNYMHFVKEATNAEYAIAGKFKALDCCAKGYRSIEWLKNGKQYPWRTSSSTFILYPQNGNQTIYTNIVGPEDEGNYTCIVRNDTAFYSHTITLKVYADKAPEKPQPTYVSDNQEVSIGHSLRLFCEAFVGTVSESLPDGRNEVLWTKLMHNGTSVNFKDDDTLRVRSRKVSREEGQTFGTYLIIDEVTSDDFGTYVCTIEKPGGAILEYVQVREKIFVEYLNPNPVPWKSLLLIATGLVLFAITIAILNRRFGLMLRVKFKDRFGALEQNDGKCSDVLIAYSPSDSDFALGHLLPTLENKFNYVCASRELPSNINLWASNLMEVSKKSRRLLAVISRATVQDQWDTQTLYQAIKQLNSLDANLLLVLLEDPPKNSKECKNDQGETFDSIYRTVQHIRWRRENVQQFWMSLRLHMPPMNSQIQNIIDLTQTGSKRLSHRDTEDSLDGLV